MPAGAVTGYFRDDAARLDAPDHHADDEITLRGRIAMRSYPGGHYRYVVNVGDREFTVNDQRLLQTGTEAGLSIPIRALHLFPAADKLN